MAPVGKRSAAVPAHGQAGVLLLGNYAPDAQESMLRFSALLEGGLAEQGRQVQLVQPPVRLGALAPAGYGLGKWLGYVDKYLLFPIRLRQLLRQSSQSGPFLVHIADHSNAVYTRYLAGIPHVVTCHDLLAVRSARGEFPENPVRWSGRKLQTAILRGLNRAAHVTADSQATLEDLARLGSLPAERLSLIHVGLNYPYTPMPQAEACRRVAALLAQSGFPTRPPEGSAPRFILHVGGNQWYKNRPGVLRIYHRLCGLVPHPPLLAMAGKPLPRQLAQLADELRLGPKLLVLPDCANEDLRALYSLAELLLFPSFAEGFGWPPVEAQACGCRVLVSRIPPLPEVAGDSAFFIEPRELDAAAAVLRDALAEPAEARQARIEQGKHNALRFDPQKMLTAYLALYDRLAKR